ncbi:ATP-binding protein [Eubacterium aggregans]|uniref:ATP-binding protein n=1 Tax=Eubacterium aggregans TaxID=81409 RepID=UPI003F3C72F0
MQFIGRKKELQKLQNAWASQDAFILLDGRKYIGKTTLAQAFAEGKQALYFSAGNVSDVMNRRAFEKAFIDYCGGASKASAHTTNAWKDMLRLFADRPGTERKVLIIDNFNFLVQVDPGILSVFRHAWENILKPNFAMVVLIVPTGRLLLNMSEKSKSFMGRLTHRISLKQVTFVELMKDFSHHDFNQLMMLYAIVGGVPRYWEYFRECIEMEEFISAIGDFFLNPYGDLLDEPVKLIENEVMDPTEYHSVLSAMASGVATIADIAVLCGYKNEGVEDLMGNLLSLGFVARNTSIIEKKFSFRKAVEYQIADPLLCFWYTFVFPSYQQITAGQDSVAVEQLMAGFEEYIQAWFKKVAVEILLVACKQKTIPINCDTVGSFFNKATAVDIVGIDNTRKCLFLGDCAYRGEAYTKADYEAFVDKCEEIKELRAYKDYDRVYGVFANRPFESDLMEYAMLTKNVLLFNGITIYSLNS